MTVNVKRLIFSTACAMVVMTVYFWLDGAGVLDDRWVSAVVLNVIFWAGVIVGRLEKWL